MNDFPASCQSLVYTSPIPCHRIRGFRREVPRRQQKNPRCSQTKPKPEPEREMHEDATPEEDGWEKAKEDV
jgi:hypothetical protein